MKRKQRKTKSKRNKKRIARSLNVHSDAGGLFFFLFILSHVSDSSWSRNINKQLAMYKFNKIYNYQWKKDLNC